MKWPSEAAKVRLIAKNANKVRKAFKDAIDGDAIAQSWEETHPAGGSVSPQTARDWARTHAITNKKPMQNALAGIYANGYVFGERTAKAHLAGLKKDASPISVGVVDWSTWKPGNESAAALVKPRGGLKRLLETRKITIADEVINTKLDRIGTALATSLKKGYGAKETAQLVNKVINDPEAAMVIARTETARAVSIATRDEYETNNVQQVEWVFGEEGVCDICSENADVSPIGIDETFPSGDAEPPAHPNCMCTLVPYYEPLEDLPELADEAAVEEPTVEDLTIEEPTVEEPIVEESDVEDISVEEISTPIEVSRSEHITNKMPYEWKPKPKYDEAMLDLDEYKDALKAFKEVAKSDVAIRIGRSALTKMVEDGRMKSSVEVETNLGGRPISQYYRDARYQLENVDWGVPTNVTQPIYGFMDTAHEGHFPNVENYGQIKIVLKDVSHRVTVSAGDTLDNNLVPVLLTDAKKGKIPNMELSGAVKNATWAGSRGYGYFEAQVHGGVTLGDISTIYLNDAEISAEAINALQSRGIKVLP